MRLCDRWPSISPLTCCSWAAGGIKIPPKGLVVGDMERLPFADRSFDKACCLNAFHHVPDSIGALREIRRCLEANGVVFFSEPGAGHSSQPGSLAASRNYGVLEKEVLIDQFMDECLAAGFADVAFASHHQCHAALRSRQDRVAAIGPDTPPVNGRSVPSEDVEKRPGVVWPG